MDIEAFAMVVPLALIGIGMRYTRRGYLLATDIKNERFSGLHSVEAGRLQFWGGAIVGAGFASGWAVIGWWCMEAASKVGP